ncbi:hypothetical protein WA026_021583 [Henosepilachna vigintioctopunctata]|uniref:Uncharacterized protein n=1 Tax=Henosepilachna vigintioctopunctata TaxID=420089 RepID=A0AAW1UXW6_9CUCU
MNVVVSLLCLHFFVMVLCRNNEVTPDIKTANETAENHTNYLVDIEIIKMYMTSPNSLKLFWGSTSEDVRMNKTYGLFYDIDNKENMKDPKVITQDPCIEVLNLDYCKKFFFAVASMNGGKGINPNSSNIRSIVTLMDPLGAPLNVRADFLPGRIPCLLIKWTASCKNIKEQHKYKIRLVENSTQGQTANILRTLLSTKFEQACTVPVHYGNIYEISVANDMHGASYSDIVKLKIPNFIQPYDVRLAVNSSNGAFLLYWREPFVPVCNGQYFYEVLVFNDKNVTSRSNYTVFRVNRPGFVYKGNLTEYTFGVDLVCCDYSEKSRITDLVYGNTNGDVKYLNVF